MSLIPIIPRKEIGKFTIYERKPKPKGFTKYTVGITGPGQNMVKDFGRYSVAVRWCKAETPRPVPRIVIHVTDGIVQGVVSDVPLIYTVADEDAPLGDAPRIPLQALQGLKFLDDTDPVPCATMTAPADVNPERVNAVLHAIKQHEERPTP